MPNEIKRIYLGLPASLVEKVLWVARDYRTNVLSHQPGGSDVVVEYQNNSVLGYDWIKYPSRYIRKIMLIRPGGNVTLDVLDQLETIRLEINRIYARKYINNDEFFTMPFKEIWNAQTSIELPWDKLVTYDQDYVEEVIGKNIIGRVSLSRFKEVTKMERLEFKRMNGIGVCSTPIGTLYLAKDVDLSKEIDIILVGDTIDKGELWLVNRKEPDK